MRSPSTDRRSAAHWPVILLTVALVGILAACRGLTCPAAAEPADILAATAAATPGLRFGVVRTYTGEGLYEFMDGAAVTYLEHHFRTLAATDVFRGADQAKIELYSMAAAADAATLYGELTGSPGTPFAAGEVGCFWAGFEPEALFRRGRFLVRLLGYAKERDAAASLLAEVAAALDAQVQ